MRSKKLRTSCDNDATWSQREGASCSGPCHTCKLHITALPTDVLANVFRYCPYEDVALQLRPVCRRFCDVATMVLNSGFSTMGPKIYRAMEAVQLSVTSAPTDTCLTALSGAFSLLEVLELQVSRCKEKISFAVSKKKVCNTRNVLKDMLPSTETSPG
jgi:hypothetical protein